MNEYPKIKTIWTRDSQTNEIGEFTGEFCSACGSKADEKARDYFICPKCGHAFVGELIVCPSLNPPIIFMHEKEWEKTQNEKKK